VNPLVGCLVGCIVMMASIVFWIWLLLVVLHFGPLGGLAAFLLAVFTTGSLMGAFQERDWWPWRR